MARCVITPPIRLRPFIEEVFKLGVLSLIIICVCGVAVGMVLGLQGYNTLVTFGATQSLGAVVGLSLVRELGPRPYRAAGHRARRLGDRRGDRHHGRHRAARRPANDVRRPDDFVVTPKALAMIVVMPLLSALFIVSGLFGGYLVGVRLMGVDPGSYMNSLQSAVDFSDDILGSLLKALVFGVLVGLIATYRGYKSEPTSAGVSAATTSTVVIASVSHTDLRLLHHRLVGSMSGMNRSGTRDFIVGLFVLAGLAAIAYLSLSVGGLSYFGNPEA